MSNTKNIYQFQDILYDIQEECLRELERGQTDRQTECINTFQLRWKVLKRVIKIYFHL